MDEIEDRKQYWEDYFAGKVHKPKSPRIRKIQNKSQVLRQFSPDETRIKVSQPAYWSTQTYPLVIQIGSEIMEVKGVTVLDRTSAYLELSERRMFKSGGGWHNRGTRVKNIGSAK